PQLAQEHAVIEVPAMGLAHRVVEVLHIDEYGESFHGVLRLLAPLCAGGSLAGRTTSCLSAVAPKPRLRLRRPRALSPPRPGLQWRPRCLRYGSMNAVSILRDAWYFYHRHVAHLALLCLPLLLLEALARHLLAPHLGEWQGAADLLAGLLFYPLYGAALILYLDTRTRGLTPGAAQLLAMALRLWPALALLTALSSLLILDRKSTRLNSSH